MGRKVGSKNRSTMERKARELRVGTMAVIGQRCLTKANKLKLSKAVDRVHDDAAKGDRGALRMLLDMYTDVYSCAAADHAARLIGAPALGEDYTTEDAARWMMSLLPGAAESEESLGLFLTHAWKVFQFAAEREKIAALRQSAVPVREVHQIFMVFTGIVHEVLGGPDTRHLLELYTSKLEADMMPRFPDLFEE